MRTLRGPPSRRRAGASRRGVCGRWPPPQVDRRESRAARGRGLFHIGTLAPAPCWR